MYLKQSVKDFIHIKEYFRIFLTCHILVGWMSKDFCNFTPWKNDLLTFHPAMNFNHVESVLIDYRLQYLLKISINWLIAVFTENAQDLIVTSLYLLWYIDLFEARPLLTTFIISISKIKLWYFLLFIFFRILAPLSKAL